jgi:serine/threonine protein phosphatase PrpC
LSGDAAVVVPGAEGVFLGIVDALGHGIEAHQVARRATTLLRRMAGKDLEGVLRAAHADLRGGLGAAVGLCWFDVASGDVRWLGVGNVVLRTFGSRTMRLAGQDGLVGHVMPRPRLQTVRLAPGDTLLLATDGIREQVTAEAYPGLLGDSAKFAARQVVERFGREHDDATCILLRRPA